MKDLIKGAGIIFIIKIFGAVAFLLVNIIISNYYGAAYLGIFNLLFALFQITSIFSRVGLDVFIIKMLPTIESKEVISSFLKKVSRLIFTFSCFCTILILIFADQIDLYLFRSSEAIIYIQMTAFLVIPYAFFTVLPEVLRGFDEIRNYSILRNALLNLAIIISLLFLLQYTDLNNEPAVALFLGITIATIVAFLVVILFLKKRKIPLRSKRYAFNILKESYPMFLTSSVLFLMNNVDSFMISFYKSEEQVGYYNACVRLSFGITFILTAINGYVSPKFSKYHHNNKTEELKKLYKQSVKLIWITVSPILLLLFLFPTFFLDLFGEKFQNATTTLFILNFAYMVNAFFGPTGHLLNMTGNQKQFMFIMINAFIINIIGNIILVPSYGIEGAAFSTMISMLIWNVASFITLKRKNII